MLFFGIFHMKHGLSKIWSLSAKKAKHRKEIPGQMQVSFGSVPQNKYEDMNSYGILSRHLNAIYSAIFIWTNLLSPVFEGGREGCCLSSC